MSAANVPPPLSTASLLRIVTCSSSTPAARRMSIPAPESCGKEVSSARPSVIRKPSTMYGNAWKANIWSATTTW
ncbi:MAG: hypothetical protein GY711_19320 [bacterium]|nr:hypothetical protein [bacterium]